VKRNVTLALDEEVARWVRVEAARRDMSVSAFLADLLDRHMGQVGSYERSMKEYLSRRAVPLKESGTAYPVREDLHDRSGLR
jgi:hypothetical protein